MARIICAVVESTVYNPVTQEFETVVENERQITLYDWDETNASENERRVLEIPREIAHSWTDANITSVLPNRSGLWHSFLNVSNWQTERPPNSIIQFYAVSGDNNWYYRTRVEFAEDFSKYNPVEDWSSLWKIYFEPGTEADINRLENKIDFVNDFFDSISIKFPQP